MTSPPTGEFSFVLIIAANNESEVARAMEVMARPLAGLMLDGLTVFMTKSTEFPGDG